MKLKSSILIFVVMITMLLSRMSGQTTVSDTKSSAAKIVYVPFDFTDAAEKAKNLLFTSRPNQASLLVIESQTVAECLEILRTYLILASCLGWRH